MTIPIVYTIISSWNGWLGFIDTETGLHALLPRREWESILVFFFTIIPAEI